MKQFVFSLLLLSVAFLVPVVAQEAKPKPTATPTPQIQTPDTDDVVKISTVLIQLDVTVTGKDGKIVTDLKASDFEIFENGVKRDITNFSFIPAAPSVAEKGSKSSTDRSSGENSNVPVPTVQLKREQVKRTVAVVVDDLGLSFESMASVKQALKRFVETQMLPNDLVAIVRTSVGLGGLQQFTGDKRQLMAAVEQLKWNARGRAGIGSFAQVQPTLTEKVLAQGVPEGTSGSDRTVLEDRIKQERDNSRMIDQFREDIFTDGTLGAINYIVKGMNELPGRKSLMLFSDGLSVCTTIRSDRCSNIVDSMRRLTDIVNRSSVSIYSFDARGVAITALGADDNVIGQSITSGKSFQNSARDTMRQALNDRTQQLYQSQDGLRYLATETGGLAFLNSNDLNGNLGRALNDQRGYYLLGYEPANESFDPSALKYNKLEIKVLRPDVNLRYRSGFFGVEDSDIRSSELTADQEIFKALTSPFGAKGIGVRINTLFGMDPQTGVHMRALMHVDVKDLHFVDTGNGEVRAVLDLLAVTFGANNTVTNKSGKNVVLTLRKEDLDKPQNQGFVYSFLFPLKETGGYQFGIAIRDAQSGKLGSANQFFEVPKMKKNRLGMSGLVLQNYTFEQWNRSIADPAVPMADKSDPLSDTSARKFRRGTVLEYGSEIYNAKIKDGGVPKITTQLRLFRDGQLILNGKHLPVRASDVLADGRISASGAMKLGIGMASGSYILQVVVIDELANEKEKVTTEWVQFEIVD